MTVIESIQEMDEKSASALRDIQVACLDDKQPNYDEEKAHQDADTVLCFLLKTIGCEKTVKAWEAIPKYYC